jgi:hypothetical protein|eukprot:COSAG01_NODE_4073_length_5381_cov_3.511170_4_plen_30_part_00
MGVGLVPVWAASAVDVASKESASVDCKRP